MGRLKDNHDRAIRRRNVARRIRKNVEGHNAAYWHYRAKHWTKLIKARHLTQFAPWMLNGKKGNLSPECFLFIVRAVRAGLYVTSTTGETHAPASYHYADNNLDGRGHAVDVAGPYRKMVLFQEREASTLKDKYKELYGPANGHNVRQGARIKLQEGTSLENMHDNHVHGAFYG